MADRRTAEEGWRDGRREGRSCCLVPFIFQQTQVNHLDVGKWLCACVCLSSPGDASGFNGGRLNGGAAMATNPSSLRLSAATT